MKSGRQENAIPHNLENIILINKNLARIPYNIPLKNNIQKLDLSQNQIKELPRQLPALQKLVLNQNNLQEVSDSIINSILSSKVLKKLCLSKNKLKDIPQNITEIRTLTYLDLSENYLSIISFKSSGLTYLDLSRNQFTELPILPRSLVTFNFNFNYLVSFDVTLPNLTDLSLNLTNL